MSFQAEKFDAGEALQSGRFLKNSRVLFPSRKVFPLQPMSYPRPGHQTLIGGLLEPKRATVPLRRTRIQLFPSRESRRLESELFEARRRNTCHDFGSKKNHCPSFWNGTTSSQHGTASQLISVATIFFLFQSSNFMISSNADAAVKPSRHFGFILSFLHRPLSSI